LGFEIDWFSYTTSSNDKEEQQMESTGIAVSELDMEVGEYLPAREVMWCGYSSPRQSNYSANGNGNGNTSGGFITVAVLNGNLNGNGNSTEQGNFA
jgi:hypothetical protein